MAEIFRYALDFNFLVRFRSYPKNPSKLSLKEFRFVTEKDNDERNHVSQSLGVLANQGLRFCFL